MATKTIISTHKSSSDTLPPLNTLVFHEEDGYTTILTRRPPLLVKWGTSLFFLIFCLLVAIGWFIRYPESIVTQGKLVAVNAPHSLMVRTEGRLIHLLHQDGDSVESGNLIAVLENTTVYKTVLLLNALSDSLQVKITNGNSNAILVFLQRHKYLDMGIHLGELQPNHQQFMQALQTYTQYLDGGYFLQKRQMLKSDLQTVAAQRLVLQKQLLLTKEDVALADENFIVSDKLAKQKVIAQVEYRNEKSKFLGKQMQAQQIESSLVGNDAQQNEKQQVLAALENDIDQQEAQFIRALQQWQSCIAAWQQKYLLFAPCSGRLILAGFIQLGSNMQQDDVLGSVEPPDTGYFIEATLPQHNFGKIRIGQKALLKFEAYPFEEFGAVEATLNVIKALPTDSGYLSKLILANGLITNKGKKLHYQSGLKTKVEIFIDNQRLLERFFYGMIKQTNH